MDNPFQHTSSLYLILIFCITLGISGCEDPGGVGSDLTEPRSEVVSDTLILSGVQAMSPNSYSGELNYFSAGQYEDHLFGNITAVGYLKPNLPASSDTMHADAQMLMRLMYNSPETYGDTLSDQGFDLYEIDQLWRDRALMVNDELQLSGQKLGEFTVGSEDSLLVNLSDIAPQWVDQYREYANAAADTSDTEADSTYRYETHGLALVPNNSGKIIPLYRDSTRFVIQNPEADTFDVSLNQWGYSLERDNNSLPGGTIPLYSTYESIINFENLGDIEQLDLQASGLARAELVFYENSSAMDSESGSVKRPRGISANLHFAKPENIPENIDPGVQQAGIFRVEGTFSADDNTYRFDITNLVDRIIRSGFPEEREFFVTFPNDGIVKPSLIFTDDEQVPAAFKPKIIITSLKNTSN